jgi:hypothetical protein
MEKIGAKSIIICCPGNVISGGVNSLHNLCKALNKCGFDAKMFYVEPDDLVLQNHQITSYSVKRQYQIEDRTDILIVVPETMVQFLFQFKKSQKMVYWLGLNYFFKNPSWRFPFNIKLLRKLISCRSYTGFSSGIVENAKRKLNEFAKSHLDIWNGEVIHLSNSYFVADYCKRKGAPNSYVLHNPIREEFYKNECIINREKIILFGPKTPKKIIYNLKRELPDFQIHRLIKMPITKVHDLMSKAMVFAEFGNYSGRDRMPREAAMLGCIVFMNTRGSAVFTEDYDIPDFYKIADTYQNTNLIVNRIKQSVNQFDSHIVDFVAFKDQLITERKEFFNQTKAIFNTIFQNEKV